MSEVFTASEDFKKNRLNGIRYVDKTMLLIQLLRCTHETTFFLRPRRFGKTLMLSMIKYFVEDTRDTDLNRENRALFDGLDIMDTEYTSQMTSYPVINLTFQTVDSVISLKSRIQEFYGKKRYLLESKALSDTDISFFKRILYGKDEAGKDTDINDYKLSLQNMSRFLRQEFGKGTVVLIDEYDVPLERAYRGGYYDEMVQVIGPLLQNLLKSNSENLHFAVVTGCLRVAKEGIYTGLNNPEINTVLSDQNSDAFGFTTKDVKELLSENGLSEHFQEIEKWYDGYRFGANTIYNPWSVIKQIEVLKANPRRQPQLHWAGTSENAIIRELAEYASDDTKSKMDQLMRGGTITFSHRDDLVYDELYKNTDNVFNVMLATGYLTAVDFNADQIQARIPNKEVQRIFTSKIREWFEGTLPAFNVKELYQAMEERVPEQIQQILNDKFLSAMSYFDSVEAFYHGIAMALFQMNPEYVCTSNRESGNGRFDIQCKQRRKWDIAYILEFKIVYDPKDMQEEAGKAAKQIEDKGYVTDLHREGYNKIITYGFCFCEKRCRVMLGKVYGLNSTRNFFLTSSGQSSRIITSKEIESVKSLSESSTPSDSSQRACVGVSRQDSLTGMDSSDAK